MFRNIMSPPNKRLLLVLGDSQQYRQMSTFKHFWMELLTIDMNIL